MRSNRHLSYGRGVLDSHLAIRVGFERELTPSMQLTVTVGAWEALAGFLGKSKTMNLMRYRNGFIISPNLGELQLVAPPQRNPPSSTSIFNYYQDHEHDGLGHQWYVRESLEPKAVQGYPKHVGLVIGRPTLESLHKHHIPYTD